MAESSMLENKIVESEFFPKQPESLEETGLSPVLIEELILKQLLSHGNRHGRNIAEDLGLPFKVLSPLYAEMKNRMLLAHRGNAALGDFDYQLTEYGKETALKAKAYSAYTGAAPVLLSDYLASVSAQSIQNETPSLEKLKDALSDMIVDESLLMAIGPAIHAGKGLFLFGEPGNGKTSLAERIHRAFSQEIYIPKTLWIEGELVNLFDPQNHQLADTSDELKKADARWVKIKRPTVIVGGELTLDALEITYNPTLNISEAPLQLKANGGIFLIDDFGRQRVNPKDLLNRWIVPLDKRHDFLVLSTGKKIQVPFDELIIFSTNLNPADLVDEAFLRRIPYKINLPGPDPTEIKALFEQQCQQHNIPFQENVLETFIQQECIDKNRPLRRCHPRDLIQQIVYQAQFLNQAPQLTLPNLQQAAQTYFSNL